MNAEFTVAILAFVAFSIPIVGALWKIFAIRESLQSRIQENAHRIDLIDAHFQNFNDQHITSFRGLQELTEHIRQRTQSQDGKLNDRILDMECFLEKTTPFQRRRS